MSMFALQSRLFQLNMQSQVVHVKTDNCMPEPIWIEIKCVPHVHACKETVTRAVP